MNFFSGAFYVPYISLKTLRVRAHTAAYTIMAAFALSPKLNLVDAVLKPLANQSSSRSAARVEIA